jgi:hypothetical protein
MLQLEKAQSAVLPALGSHGGLNASKKVCLSGLGVQDNKLRYRNKGRIDSLSQLFGNRCGEFGFCCGGLGFCCGPFGFCCAGF